jgi:hypothetical protein
LSLRFFSNLSTLFADLMPGYSGTPLPQKLGIKPQFHVALVELPADVRRQLKAALARCRLAKDGEGPLDLAMLFVINRATLEAEFSRLASRLAPTGMLWVSWPKKTSAMATDLTENVVREVGLKAGLVDVKVCAVTEVWSGLKFVIRRKDRA